jgi:hypothetical protein
LPNDGAIFIMKRMTASGRRETVDSRDWKDVRVVVYIVGAGHRSRSAFRLRR